MKNNSKFTKDKKIILNLENGSQVEAEIVLILDLFGDSIIIYQFNEMHFFAKLSENNSLTELDEPTFEIVEKIFMEYLEENEDIEDIEDIVKEYTKNEQKVIN